MLRGALAELAGVPGVRLGSCLHRKRAPRVSMRATEASVKTPDVARLGVNDDPSPCSDHAAIPNASHQQRLSRASEPFPGLEFVASDADATDAIRRAAAWADAALVIAPESDGVLEAVCRQVIETGCALVGPDLETIAPFADKLATAQWLENLPAPNATSNGHRLRQPGIPTELVRDEADLSRSFPAGPLVVKPRDGAGALFTSRTNGVGLKRAVARIRAAGHAGELIVQPYLEGMAASIAVIGDGKGNAVVLPALQQHIEYRSDPELGPRIEWLSYAGGRWPLPEPLDLRARRLADRVMAGLPNLRGYVGIDLVLARQRDGAGDRVVEINPRLTTSFVLYRHLFPGRLGSLLLRRDAPPPEFALPTHRALSLAADGSLRVDAG